MLHPLHLAQPLRTLFREKPAVKLSDGDYVTITALDGEMEMMSMRSVALKEPICWRSHLMDTQEGSEDAFRQLRNGTFLQVQTA